MQFLCRCAVESTQTHVRAFEMIVVVHFTYHPCCVHYGLSYECVWFRCSIFTAYNIQSAFDWTLNIFVELLRLAEEKKSLLLWLNSFMLFGCGFLNVLISFNKSLAFTFLTQILSNSSNVSNNIIFIATFGRV